jgi:hypothetical protein
MLHAADLRTKKTRDGKRGRDEEGSKAREQSNLPVNLMLLPGLMVCLESKR